MNHIPIKEGTKFGYWTAMHETRTNGRLYCHCKCICGKERDILCTVLQTGKSKSCGCRAKTGKGEDLTGRDFGQLHVIGPVVIGNRTFFQCQCKCGGSILAEGKDLRSSTVTTCGCRTGTGDKIRASLQPYCKDGTYLPGISRTHMNKNNTSGVTGVSWKPKRGKWRAYIKIQGKTIHLGYFDMLDEAAKARKAAEEEYFGKFLEP